MVWRIQAGPDGSRPPRSAREDLEAFCRSLRLHEHEDVSVGFEWAGDGWHVRDATGVSAARIRAAMRSRALPVAEDSRKPLALPTWGLSSFRSVPPARHVDRVSPRRRVPATVEGREGRLKGMILDLSSGGFRGQLHGPPLRAGDEVLAGVVLSEGARALRARARVAWVETDTSGHAVLYGFSWLEGEDLPDIVRRLPTLD